MTSMTLQQMRDQVRSVVDIDATDMKKGGGFTKQLQLLTLLGGLTNTLLQRLRQHLTLLRKVFVK